jgi:hypothetical protein
MVTAPQLLLTDVGSRSSRYAAITVIEFNRNAAPLCD